MANTSALRLASVITLFTLVLVSLFGIRSMMSFNIPKVTLGFLVIILSTIIVLACVIMNEHRIAFIVGVGGVAASASMLLMWLLLPGQGYAVGAAPATVSWFQLHADLVALMVGLLCDVGGSVACYFWLRRRS